MSRQQSGLLHENGIDALILVARCVLCAWRSCYQDQHQEVIDDCTKGKQWSCVSKGFY